MSLTFFCCDIQRVFSPLVHEFPSVVHSAKTLLHTAVALGGRVVATEQYPEKLGATVAELAPLLETSKAVMFPKTSFSMLTPAVRAHLGPAMASAAAPRTAVLFGIEVRVCLFVCWCVFLLIRGSCVLHVGAHS